MQLPVLLPAALAVLVAAGVAGRRPAPSLSWLEQADVVGQGQGADDGPPVGLGAMVSVECFAGNCVSRAASARDSRDGRAFDADFDADGDEGNALFAQPDGLDPPPTAAKRTTLRGLCDNMAEIQARVCLLRAELMQTCACEESFDTLSLGSSHYPHHVKAVRCKPLKHCRPLHYSLPVLTRRGAADQADDQMPQVPEQLRSVWRFDYKSIPVACECVHPDARQVEGARRR